MAVTETSPKSIMEPEAQEETRAASNAYTIRPDIKEK